MAAGAAGAPASTGTTGAGAASASGKALLLIGGAAAAAAGVAVATHADAPPASPTPPPCASGGDFDFTIDFAFSGSVGCGVANAQAQTYRIINRSCSPVTVQGLRLTKTASGPCSVGPPRDLDLNGATAVRGASGAPATVVIRTGAPAGTAHMACCGLYPCTVGACVINETYTVTTNAGARSVSHSVSLFDNTGRDCPPCAGDISPYVMPPPSGHRDRPGAPHLCTADAY